MTEPPTDERLRSQLLVGARAGSPVEVVERILAVQAQDLRGFRLAIRSRTDGLTVADVDRALGSERSVVVTWLNRGTLHLVAAPDYWWMHDLLASRQRAANARRLGQEGVSPVQAKRGVAVVSDAVTREGPLTRAALRARLDDAGVPTAGQALVHVLSAATIAGEVVRGPMSGRDQAFVSPTGWLGPRPAVLDRSEALARLARRYLAGHGPAAPEDLAAWAGIPVGDARLGFASIADEVEVRDDRGVGLVGAGLDHRGTAPRPEPRMLGPFDPLLHGWASRASVVGPHRGVVTSNGVFRPIALVHGRAVAIWSLAGGVLTIRLLEPISARVRGVLARDAADVLRFLGLPSRDAVFDG